MRVLTVYPSFYVYGGAELLIVKLCNYLSREGVQNSILTTSILPEIRSDLENTEIITVGKKSANILGEMLALWRGVTRNQGDFDIINVHNFPAELSAFRCRKPAVWMCNEPELYLNLRLPASLKYKLFLRSLLPLEKHVVRRYIKQVAVADEFNARRFEGLYGIRPEIIHYGIDCDFFSSGDPERARDEFSLRDRFVVLHLGMLTPMKNQMESVKTLGKLAGKVPEAKLVFAGISDNEYGESVRRYASENNLEGRVLFTGHLSRDKIRDLLHASHVLLHPIREQGGWLAPFEALCAGLPIVVSEEMTASDIIRKEGIGVVTGDYADAVLDAYERPSEHRERAQKGAEFVRGNLSWDKFSERMLGLFRRAQTEAG